MSGSNTLVPIKIEGLLINGNTPSCTRWKDLSVNYGQFRYHMLGRNLEDNNLLVPENTPHEPGMHLHWALPSALTHGIEKDGKIVLPNVPDRWLVVRWKMRAGEVVTKKWIIESNCILPDDDDGTTDTEGSSWAVKKDDGTYVSATIGRKADYEDYTESTYANAPIKATGPGNPAFAAIYKSSQNVFGMHDDLDGMTNGDTLSYFVAGWYSRAQFDPLTLEHLTAKGSGAAMAAALRKSILSKWHINGTDLPAETKAGIVCHGAIHSILLEGAPQAAFFNQSLNITVGQTAVDAKSVHLAAAAKLPELVMNAFLHDGLKDIAETAQLTDIVASKAFMNFHGGISWEIQREPKKDGKEPETTLQQLFQDSEVAENYDGLVKWQNIHNTLAEELTTLITELRALSDKLIMAESNEVQEAAVTVSTQTVRQRISDVATEMTVAHSNIQRHRNAIGQNRNFNTATPLFELVEKKLPRYWQPADPTVLFSGSGLASGKYSESNAEELECRTDDQPTTSLTSTDIEGYNSSTSTNVPENHTLHLRTLSGLTPTDAATISKLFSEALLFSPNYIAASIAQSFAAQASLIGIEKWQQPFTPIHMIWGADFYPTYTMQDGQPLFSSEDWHFNGTDYRYIGNGISETKPISYSGKAIVTDSLAELLALKLPHTMLQENLSQAISGFSDSLLMRNHPIQLPLMKRSGDWLADDDTIDSFLSSTLSQAFTAGQAPTFSPLIMSGDGPGDFFPIRAGHLQLTHLSLVDAFGQAKNLMEDEQTEVAISGNLSGKLAAPLITLQPAIVQKARLNFRWCQQSNSEVESNSNPSSSPVCGWLLPDNLNNKLHIYEASGQKCGSLAITDNGTVVRWTAPPGKHASMPHNQFLKQFVESFFPSNNLTAPATNRTSDLLQLLKLCKAKADTLNQKSNMPGIGKLIGQPLVLARASIGLQLCGMPAQPQDWAHSITPSSMQLPPGLSDISFPVSIGNASSNRDGLIGYWENDGFDTMLLSGGNSDSEQPLSHFSNRTLTLRFNPSDTAVNLTLLLDPCGGITANCGLLPSKYIELPQSFTDHGLNDMDINIMVAPVLGNLSAPFIPVSTEQKKTWQLMLKSQDGTWANEISLDGRQTLTADLINTQTAFEGYIVLQKDNH